MDPLHIFICARLSSWELETVSLTAALHGAVVCQSSLRALPTDLIPALVEGGTIVIVEEDQHATLAVSIGADEILRAGEISEASVFQAIQQARARARSRNQLSHLKSASSNSAWDLLCTALVQRLSQPIVTASVALEASFCGITPVLEASDAFTQSAIAPNENTHSPELQSILALRNTGPTSADLIRALSEAKESVMAAGSVLSRLEILLGTHAPADAPVELSQIVEQLADLLVPAFGPNRITVEATAPCAIPIPANRLTWIVLTLVSWLATSSQKTERTISLRLSEEEGCVVLDAMHAGGTSAPDSSKGFVTFTSPQSAALASLNAELDWYGAEILVDNGSDYTHIRVMFPNNIPAAQPRSESSIRNIGSSKHRAVSLRQN